MTKKIKYKTVLFFIFLIGVYLRYQYMIGSFLIEDDFSYTKRSLEILRSNIDFSTFTFSDYRFLIYVPQVIIYYFFGLSPFTIVSWPFITSVLHIYLVYKISLLLYKNYETALISSFLMAIAPVNVLEIRLYPDAIFSFFISLSVFFSLKSAFASKRNNAFRFSLYSFFIISVTFLIRENAFLIFPFLISIFFCVPENKKHWVKALLSYMLFIFFIITISMLSPVNPADKVCSMLKIRNTIDWSNAGVQITFFPFFDSLHYPIVLGYGFLSVFLTGAIYLFSTFKNKGDIIVISWFFTVYIYFEFISPLHGLRPVEGSFRYFTPFVAPMMLVIARFINQWVFKIESESIDNKIVFLTIMIAIILQIQFGNIIGLFPVVLFFLYSFFLRKRNFPLSEKTYKINLTAMVSIVFLFVATFMYTLAASYAYNRSTLNRLTRNIYSILSNFKQGVIVSNNFMTERKLNLFINKKFIERNDIQKKNIEYIILIRNDISDFSYKEKQLRDDSYNNFIIQMIKSGAFMPVIKNDAYQIFKKYE